MEANERHRLSSLLEAAQNELATLIGSSPNLDFGPDAIRIDVIDRADVWPTVSIDPDYQDGVLVTLSIDIVRQIEAAVREISSCGEAGFVRASYLSDDRLIAMALHWLLLHEISHWALGHLHLWAERSGLKFEDVRLSCEGNEFTSEAHATVSFEARSEMLRCFELQADTSGTFLFDMLHFEEDEPEANPGATPPLEQLTLSTKRRSALLAIGIVILLLQRRRGEMKSASHPWPEARAFAVMQTAVGQLLKPYGTIRNGDLFLALGDRLQISTVKDTFKQAFEVFHLDLTQVAHALSAREIFGREEIVPVDFIEGVDIELTATLRDFLLYFLDPEANSERFVTPGATEFAALRGEHKKLQADLSRYAFWGQTS